MGPASVFRFIELSNFRVFPVILCSSSAFLFQRENGQCHLPSFILFSFLPQAAAQGSLQYFCYFLFYSFLQKMQ